MVNRNQLDLEYYLELDEINYYNFRDYLDAFVELYALNNPDGMVIMCNHDLDELLIDSGIEETLLHYFRTVEYGDDYEILDRNEGDILGQAYLEQDGRKYIVDVVVCYSGCKLYEGYDFKTLRRNEE